MPIMIVDDNARMRAVLRTMLQTMDVEIRECSDAEEALEAYNVFKPRCVVMDVRMPGKDGMQALRELRVLDPAACVIIMTDYNEPEMLAAIMAAGAHAFVPKDELMQIPSVISRLE